MKQIVRSAFFFGAAFTIASVIGGCAKEMPSEAAATVPSAIQGTWAYQSTDGHDLSGYGIIYSFQGTTWTYTLGDAGSKQYDFTSSGNTFTATLRQNSVSSNEQAGSEIAGQYHVSSDTLEMVSDGHTAILIRQ